jgi:diguanylate cyclase (GGDEF)-like protein
MDDYIYIYDISHDYYYISPSSVKRFKLPAAEFNNVVETHKLFVYPDDFPILESEIEQVVSGKKEFHNLLYRWISVDNEPVWVNCRGQVVYSDSGKYMAGCINEVGNLQKADNVSGLLGLSNFHDDFYKSPLFSGKGFVLRLGIDDFKVVNEKHGVEYGNTLLKETSDCIKKCLSRNQYLYRGGADEFVIVDYTINDVEFVFDQYRKIREAIDRLVVDNNYKAIFTISGGALMGKECMGYSFSDCMKFSEFALNEAKRQGKNRCLVFNTADYEKFLRKRRLLQLLRESINNDFEGFEPYLQPLVTPQTGEIYGAEALMRFHTKEFGTVSPTEFIPILEETGLIVPAGKWMLCRSLELCNQIHQTAPDFRISINISYIQVLKSNIISEILSAVADYDVLPSMVIIELTESGLVASDSRVSKLCARMKEIGIRLALDDFGTGYSNFHYFNDLDPDIIKIDRTFTVKAVENEYEFKLLSLMTDMAHNMNMRVCVEGIETPEELEKIKSISPDYCQGFYFGRPCPYEEFVDKFIKKSA